jgi:FkbM family methyltransferase
MVRRFAERATHRLVIRRRLPSPFGKMRIYTTSEGGLRYLQPNLQEVDPTLLRLVTELVRPGDIVWDIGANVGLFSFAAAAAAGPSGQVLAVEPDAALVTLIRRSAALNNGSANGDAAPVAVLPVAIAAELSVGLFHIARRNRSTSYLDGFGTTQTVGIRSSELVPAVTLNWLATHFPPPNVIKIDVEGAEISVLSGAADILESLPAVICEVASCNATGIAEILATHGYALYDGDLSEHLRVPLTVAPPATLAIHGSADRLKPGRPARTLRPAAGLAGRGHVGTGRSR